jgi:urease accessory protein
MKQYCLQSATFTSAIILIFSLGWPQVASAHIGGGQATGFFTGLQHPWSGLDHVLAMIAVGLWGAQLGSPALWVLPIAFPMMMSMGAMMGLIGIPLPGVEIGIAFSAIILGSMIVSKARPKLGVAIAMVGVFAIFHGHAHGTELPAGQSGLLYSMGFVIATGCLHGLGIALGLVNGIPKGKLVLRGAGTFIAVMGVVFLWRAMT